MVHNSDGQQAAEPLAQLGSLARRTEKVSRLSVRHPSAEEILPLTGDFRSASAESDLRRLGQKATDSQTQAIHSLARLANGQRQILDLEARRDEAKSLDLGPKLRINQFRNWRKVAGEARSEVVRRGLFSESSAKRHITMLGKAEVSVTAFTSAASEAIAAAKYEHDSAARLEHRALAGSLMAAAIARLNTAVEPTIRPQDSPSTHDFNDLEKDVFDSLRAGTDGLHAARRLREAGEESFEAASVRAAASDPSAKAGLLAATSLLNCVEAQVLGRILEWRLKWRDRTPRDAVRRLPWSTTDPSPGAFLRRAAEAANLGHVQGRVVSLRYTGRGTRIDLDDDGVMATAHVPWVDANRLGIGVGAYVSAYGDFVDGDATQISVSHVPIAYRPRSWQEWLRQEHRGIFLANPFGLSLNSSWLKGPNGAARLVSDPIWFT